MYILPPVHELTVIGIFDAGVPNAERIVLRPTEPINLASFALTLSAVSGAGMTPIADQFLWLGERWISPPAWIVVFTGPGAFREGTHQTTGEPVLELHWGKPGVLFGRTEIAVSLLKIGSFSSSVSTPPSPASTLFALLNPRGRS